jgi:SAM-dependent methyltransferase
LIIILARLEFLALSDRGRWNERYRSGHGPRQSNPRLQQQLHRLRPGRVLDLAGGVGANAPLFAGSRLIIADISEEALALAGGIRVQADAGALPFAPASFDTIVCTYFYDPTLDLAALLVPGGTLYFETYTPADRKYRPDYNPAHRFDPALAATVFRGLQIELLEEADDGWRVVATVIGRKPAA